MSKQIKIIFAPTRLTPTSKINLKGFAAFKQAITLTVRNLQLIFAVFLVYIIIWSRFWRKATTKKTSNWTG